MENLKKTADRLMEKDGEIRGEILLGHLEFVKREEGQGGLDRLIATFEELGYPIDLEEINPMGWIKISWGTMIGVLGKELFDWKDEDVKKMGSFAPKVLTINKLFMRHLVSVDMLLAGAEKYWKKACTVGKLEIVEKMDGYAEVDLKDYDYHPVDCLFISGYVETVFGLCTKGQVEVKELKCIHKGDGVHRFSIIW